MTQIVKAESYDHLKELLQIYGTLETAVHALKSNLLTVTQYFYQANRRVIIHAPNGVLLDAVPWDELRALHANQKALHEQTYANHQYYRDIIDAATEHHGKKE